MKRLLLPLIASLSLLTPAIAGLGDAEEGMDDFVSDRIYDAWC